jgi:hypothetical protein
MWIFLNDSFLSIVAHADDPGLLLVRGRHAGDIERVFPTAQVTSTPTADYRYRAVVARDDVAAAIAGKVTAIYYTNVKNTEADAEGRAAYLDVWGRKRHWQEAEGYRRSPAAAAPEVKAGKPRRRFRWFGGWAR